MTERIEQIRELLELLVFQDLQDKSIKEILYLATECEILSLCDLSRFLLFCEISQIPYQ